MDKASSTLCAWEWRGKWAMSCSVEDAGEGRSSCLLPARKPSLGRVQLRGVPTQRRINNANSITWCFLLTTWRGEGGGAEAMVCAGTQPWGDEYLCGQHIKFHFNKYYFEGFNKLILALSTPPVNAWKRWMGGIFCTFWWVRKPLNRCVHQPLLLWYTYGFVFWCCQPVCPASCCRYLVPNPQGRTGWHVSGLGDSQDLRQGWAPWHGRAQKRVGAHVMKSLAPDLLGTEKLTPPGQLAGAGGRLLPSSAMVFSHLSRCADPGDSCSH